MSAARNEVPMRLVCAHCAVRPDGTVRFALLLPPPLARALPPLPCGVKARLACASRCMHSLLAAELRSEHMAAANALGHRLGKPLAALRDAEVLSWPMRQLSRPDFLLLAHELSQPGGAPAALRELRLAQNDLSSGVAHHAACRRAGRR